MRKLDLVKDELDICILKCHILSAASVVLRVFQRLFFSVCSAKPMIHLQICVCIDGQKFRETELKKDGCMSESSSSI